MLNRKKIGTYFRQHRRHKELVIKEPVLRVERRAMALSNRLTTATTAI
jgi:hypothetical protein